MVKQMQKLSYRKTAITLLLIAIAVVAVAAVYLFESNKARTGNVNPFTNSGHTQSNTPISNPLSLYDYNYSVLNPQVTEVSGTGFLNNVSQGLSLEVNITFTSFTNQPITIPMENLIIYYYNSTVNLHNWINNNDSYSVIQQQAFNYSFSQSQLTLQPNMSNSTLLTINLTQNAPIGQYIININLGKVEATNTSIQLEMIVTPKTT
jgi:hypothetical protein